MVHRSTQIDTIRKMEKLVGRMFENLSATYEKYGYDYFYNADDEVVNDACAANGYTLYILKLKVYPLYILL